MYKIKKAKIVLQKLSKQEIDDLTKHGNIKIRPKISRPPQRSANNNFATSVLRKDYSGKKPRFTFSTYKHARKTEGNTTFIVRCLGVEKFLTYWNSHHLFQH